MVFAVFFDDEALLFFGKGGAVSGEVEGFQARGCAGEGVAGCHG